MLLLTLFFGCSVKNSDIVSIAPIPSQNNDREGCSWVRVEEENTMSIFMLPVSLSDRAFGEELYYCCPSKEIKTPPICVQADWYKATKSSGEK